MNWLDKLKHKYNRQRLVTALLMLFLSIFPANSFGSDGYFVPTDVDCTMVGQHADLDRQDAACFAQEHLHCHKNSLVAPLSLAFAAPRFLPANSARQQVSFVAVILADDPPPPRS